MGNKKGLLKSILPWLIVLMVISVAIPFFNQSESSEIRYDKFIKIVQDEKVKEDIPTILVDEKENNNISTNDMDNEEKDKENSLDSANDYETVNESISEKKKNKTPIIILLSILLLLDLAALVIYIIGIDKVVSFIK